jgi:hypothetical protein
MRLELNDPAEIPTLLVALRRAGCVAAPSVGSTVDVGFPWVSTLEDARQALVELTFFAKAWASAHPGLELTVEAMPQRAG